MIGVVTGFRAEARCVPAGLATVVCSGADPERARSLAGDLAQDGTSLLISFGVAGALDPALASGDLVIPMVVSTPDGQQLACDPSLHAELAAALAGSGARPAAARSVAGSTTLVATPAAKRVLLERTGAAMVDMESYAVAEAATGAGLPFLVVRAIADTAHEPIPSVARSALRPDGRTDVAAVVRGLLAHPGELPDLLRLASGTRRALKALAQAGRVLARLEV